MAPPKRPDDLAAELELIELQRIADRAQHALLLRTFELVDERRLTAAKAASLLGISVSTVWRRMASLGMDTRERASS